MYWAELRTTTTPLGTHPLQNTRTHMQRRFMLWYHLASRICLRPNYRLNYILLTQLWLLIVIGFYSSLVLTLSMLGDPNLIGTLKTADHGVLIRISSWQYIPLWPSLNMVYGGSCCLALQVSLYGHVMHLHSRRILLFTISITESRSWSSFWAWRST